MIPARSFWTVEDLIADWGVTPDAIADYATDGKLQLTLKTLNGQPRDGITAEEKTRFESSAKSGGEPAQHPAQRKSDRYLLGVMAALWLGEDPMLDAHYRVRDQIASDAEVKGIPMWRSRETDANAIKEGLELLRESGYKPRRVGAGMPTNCVADQSPAGGNNANAAPTRHTDEGAQQVAA